jgi:hypothetical protein
MKKRRFALCLAGVLVVAGITNLIRNRVAAQVPQELKEFTIIRSETPTTKVPVKLMSFDAQRADGARANGDYDAPNSPANIQHLHSRFVVLPSVGERVSVDDTSRTRITMYTKSVAGQPVPDPTCGFGRIPATLKPKLKAKEIVLGFATIVVETDDGPLLTTTWKAPDLDCAVIKMTEDRRDEQGTVTGHFELQALQIKLGPPDPKFFDIPREYVEMSPSQQAIARRNATGATGPILPPANEALQQRDARYFQNHQQAGK